MCGIEAAKAGREASPRTLELRVLACVAAETPCFMSRFW